MFKLMGKKKNWKIYAQKFASKGSQKKKVNIDKHSFFTYLNSKPTSWWMESGTNKYLLG